LIRVYKYKDTGLFNIYYDTDEDEFFNIYYDTDEDEFCLRKRLYGFNYFSPIEWKYAFGKRKRENGVWIQQEYRYVILYNPETKKDHELMNLNGSALKKNFRRK
jgi:hypothetical protein